MIDAVERQECVGAALEELGVDLSRELLLSVDWENQAGSNGSAGRMRILVGGDDAQEAGEP